MVICFREKVFLCRVYFRDYIGVYNLIFGGKCIVFFWLWDKNEIMIDDLLIL